MNYCCEKQYARARVCVCVCVSGCGVGRCVSVRESCSEHRLQGSYLRATLATRVTLPQVHPRVVVPPVFSSLHAASTKLYAAMEHDATVWANEFRLPPRSIDRSVGRSRERERERERKRPSVAFRLELRYAHRVAIGGKLASCGKCGLDIELDFCIESSLIYAHDERRRGGLIT